MNSLNNMQLPSLSLRDFFVCRLRVNAGPQIASLASSILGVSIVSATLLLSHSLSNLV